MANHKTFDEFSVSRYGRKILQTNSSSSSFNPSQPIFIALYCIISLLALALFITIFIFCNGYFSRREKKFKNRYQNNPTFKKKSFIRNDQQQPIVPISMTPTSGSAYSTRSTEHLLSNRHYYDQTSSIDRLASRRFQQSMIDAYLNDLRSFQPSEINVEQLRSYLFVDLHSTSSETIPDYMSKMVNNNNTISSTPNQILNSNEYERQRCTNLKQQIQSRSNANQPYISRYVMRERFLPNNLGQLPQLHQQNIAQEGDLFQFDDTTTATTSMSTINTEELQSSNAIDDEEDEKEDSHVYHVQRHEMMKENPSMINPKRSSQPAWSPMYCYCNRTSYYFEKVSTSNIDDSDIEIPYKASSDIGKGSIYTNDTIIV